MNAQQNSNPIPRPAKPVGLAAAIKALTQWLSAKISTLSTHWYG